MSKPFNSADYDTILNKEQEASYQKWLNEYVPEYQRNTDDYDLRGYYLYGLENPNDLNVNLFARGQDQHFIDRFKKPNHPTFSNQSIYHGRDGYYGGTWQENTRLDGSKQYTFYPHETSMWSPDALRDYFLRAEIGNILMDSRAKQNNNPFLYTINKYMR